MLTVVMRTIGCIAILCGGVVMAGCSKKEPPVKEQAAKAEKPAMAAEPQAKPVQTPMIPPHTRFVPPSDTNAPAISNEESMRRAKERSKEFRRKAFEQALLEMGKEIARLESEMASAETAARTNPPLAEAWAAVGEKRAAYDAERGNIPGMKALYEKREAAKARLAAEKAKADPPPVDSVVAGLRDEIRRLGGDMVAMELKGREGNAVLQKAQDEFRAAESAYRARLLLEPPFGELAKKHEELSLQCESILKRQSDLAKEGRKHE